MNLDWIKLGTIGLALFLVYALTSNYLINSSTNIIGYDEGIYIINAMGHYEDTPIKQPVGSWLDAIEKGMMRTGDPPGIFFFLHFWEKISMSEQWLRLLPFLFFCVGIVSLIRISNLLGFPPFISVAMGYLPLASAASVYHSIEIRAYIMELGLNYYTIYLSLTMFYSIYFRKSIKLGAWLWFTIILIIGVSSRWSFIINSAAIFGALFIYIVHISNGLNFYRNFAYLFLSALTTGFAFALFYLMAFGANYGIMLPFLSDHALISININEYINTNDSTISKIFTLFRRLISTLSIYPGLFYENWELLLIILYYIVFLSIIYILSEYIFEFILITKNKFKNILRYTSILGYLMIGIPLFVNPFILSVSISSGIDLTIEKQIIFWLFDLSCILIGYVLTRNKQNNDRIFYDHYVLEIKKHSYLYIGFILVPILAFMISMLLEYLNLYPFSPRNRPSLYIQAHFNVFIICLLYVIFRGGYLKSNWEISLERKNIISGIICVAIVVQSLTYGYFYSRYNIIYRGGGGQNTKEVIKKILSDQELKKIKYWYISSGEANSFKYHVLSGNMRGSLSLDAQVIVEKWNSDKESVAGQLSYIYENANPGDKIVMITGHARENDQKYLPAFKKAFKENVIIGEFVQSSMIGEESLGGEQAYFAVR